MITLFLSTTIGRLAQSRKVVVAVLTWIAGFCSTVGGAIVYVFSTHGSLFKPETAKVWLAVGGAMSGMGLWLANTVIKGIAAEDSAIKANPGSPLQPGP